MTDSYLAPRILLSGGPDRFRRQVERLLGQLGFKDVVDIDGSGDHGGDLLGTRNGQLWVFQSKWKRTGAVDCAAVDEASRAQDHYGASRAVVVTNTRPSADAEQRARELLRIGRRVDFWNGGELQELLQAAEEHPLMTLRDYQDSAATALWADLQRSRRALLVLATGLGKTVVGGEVIGRFLRENPGQDVLVVAHQKPLVNQLERALWRHLPKRVKTQVLSSDDKPTDLAGVTCATTASALNAVLRGWRPGLVMVDETHHVGEDGQYYRLLDALKDSWQFGVTATPWRGDKYDIETRFGAASFKLGIEDGMRRGYLAAVDYRLFVDNIDWDAVREASEHQYSIKELNSRLFLPQRDEAVIDALIDAWHQTPSPRGIVFCQTIEHCERMETLLRRLPQWRHAAALHTDMPKRERQQRLLDFRAGRIPVLTAVDILNEGVDVPDVNILAFARVTHSRRIFVQQLGRGLRLREGKDTVLALDFVSDIRRVAALLNLRRQLDAEDIEVLPRVPQPKITFDNIRAESLLEQWILDAADLETSNDEAKLQFLDPEVLPA
ncbi:DEAD/DEAH box helicase family protein [Geodermatophilus normandii]|uniref:DEAD/DEAH box helicase family protein n=1 Tax=Geodermatophilus normandii TaxID=1137989 RepID=A0A6P0GK48_9ACTN|nr:DEAD/DEAH box helicase family protein [Geodermatophilus normandii]